LQAHGGTPTPNENVGCDYCLRKNLRKLALLLTPEGLCGASFHNSDGILYVERERERERERTVTAHIYKYINTYIHRERYINQKEGHGKSPQ
jgi:hypothetical protein